MLNISSITKRLFLRYLNSGVDVYRDPEISHRILIVNLFGLVGFVITLILGLNAYLEGSLVLGAVLVVSSLLFFASHQYQWLFRKHYSYKASAFLNQVSLNVLMLYLIYSGGSNNTGPLWVFLVPPVMMFFGGLKGGLISTSVFIFFYCVLMFYPNDQLLEASYTVEFKTRILYSFLTLTFLVGYYENSRYKAFLSIQELSEKYEQQARSDHLTGIANRRAMFEHLTYERHRNERTKEDMMVLLVDVDHFKLINDRCGHECGDYVLQEIAKLFVGALRKQDLVARWGGEEFLISLPQTTADGAYDVAEKIRRSVADNVLHYDGEDVAVTVSIGIGQISQEITIDETVKRADEFLYEAKQDGRNRVRPCKAA